jgi:hypothetical protein
MIVISFTHFRRVIGNILQLDNLLTTDMIKLVKAYTLNLSGFMVALHSVQLETGMTTSQAGEPVVIYIAPISQYSYNRNVCTNEIRKEESI